ncbi:MAG: helix-turn-helix domain-containing protein [Flavobacteriales bacterium]
MALRYQEYAPSEVLRPVVDRFWFFSSGGDPMDISPVQQCIPDGMVEIILIRSSDQYVQSSDQWSKHPDIFVVGMMREPVSWAMSGGGRMMGIRLRPEAAIELFGMPLKEISAFGTDAGAVLGRRWLHDLEQLREAEGEHEALRTAERILLNRETRCTRTMERFTNAMRRMRTNGAVFDKRGAGDRLHVCDRQVQRLFKEFLGLSPTCYHRIMRFRRAYEYATNNGQVDWGDLAFHLGFADQAHLVRDFRSFCGLTPRMLQERRAPTFLLRGELAPA